MVSEQVYCGGTIMKRKTRILCAAVITTVCMALALAFLPALLHGNDARPAAPAHKLVIHEWGTFTSFAGSDGVNLEFRPLVTNDLPRFIMNPSSQSASPFLKSLSKDQYVALQRMETPV